MYLPGITEEAIAEATRMVEELIAPRSEVQQVLPSSVPLTGPTSTSPVARALFSSTSSIITSAVPPESGISEGSFPRMTTELEPPIVSSSAVPPFAGAPVVRTEEAAPSQAPSSSQAEDLGAGISDQAGVGASDIAGPSSLVQTLGPPESSGAHGLTYPAPSIVEYDQRPLALDLVAHVPKREAVRRLLESLAPTLNLLTFMSAAAGSSGVAPFSARPVMHESTIQVTAPAPSGAMVAESPATASVSEMGLEAHRQFDRFFKMGTSMILHGHRPFSFVEAVLNGQLTTITMLMGEQWTSGLVHLTQELGRLSKMLYELDHGSAQVAEEEAAQKLKAEQEQAYNDLYQLVLNKRDYVDQASSSLNAVQEAYLREQAAYREDETLLAQDRAMLEEAQRRVTAREQQLESRRLQLEEYMNRNNQLTQEVATVQAALPVDEERLANVRLLPDEELRRRAVDVVRANRAQERVEVVHMLKRLANLR